VVQSNKDAHVVLTTSEEESEQDLDDDTLDEPQIPDNTTPEKAQDPVHKNHPYLITRCVPSSRSVWDVLALK
jgi:hypothetical protein